MMHCELCDEVKRHYNKAVLSLHSANQRLRRSSAGTLEAALRRREVHANLSSLIAAAGQMTAHTASHLLSVIPVAERAGARV
jgi:hypothetical protein